MLPLKPHGACTNFPSEVELNNLDGISTTAVPATKMIHKPWSTGLLGKGWRPNILLGSILAFVVFSFNLGVTIFTTVSKRDANGRRILFQGDCERAGQVNTAIHFVINGLSTILLGGSNYGMQCMSAPTRKEVDQAHASRYWLDIGVLSLRNLSRISARRRFLWFLMAMSSVPLHLL
jgi:hypothetical protein